MSKEDYISFKNLSINEYKKRLEDINLEILSINNSLNKTIDKEEDAILKEYYDATSKKASIESVIEKLENDKIKLSNELEEFEHTIKQGNSLYNEKNNLLKELEIEVNRSDVKLDNLLNTLNETYSITYEKAISMYKLDIDKNIARNKISTLKRKIKDLGPVNIMAEDEYKRVSDRYEFLIGQQEDLKNAERIFKYI